MGRNLARLFSNNGYNVVAPHKIEFNLLNEYSVRTTMERVKPDIVIHAAIIGGTILDTDTASDIVDNVEMYENIVKFTEREIPFFVIGSGAEFGKQRNIVRAKENDIYRSYPVDPYGIAKNIISRRVLDEHKGSYVVRLFGCFNEDAEDFRFVKKIMLDIQNNRPIVIDQNKMMDFFYMDDVFTVMDHLIKHGGHRNLNLVYRKKYSLVDIIHMIMEICDKHDHPLIIEDPSEIGRSYTGDDTRLSAMKLQLIGLKEGLKRTCLSK